MGSFDKRLRGGDGVTGVPRVSFGPSPLPALLTRASLSGYHRPADPGAPRESIDFRSGQAARSCEKFGRSGIRRPFPIRFVAQCFHSFTVDHSVSSGLHFSLDVTTLQEVNLAIYLFTIFVVNMLISPAYALPAYCFTAFFFSLSNATPTDEFDFVIIGGGTAGLTVANRLTELPYITVAVIEAGDKVFNNPNVTDPDKFTVALGTPIDWQYESTNQTYAAGQKISCPAGKALGGTSTINGKCSDNFAVNHLSHR